MSAERDPFWCVVPAAGVGARMRADRPKQYLPLSGKCIIEHTLSALVSHPLCAGVLVAIADHDPYWDSLDIAKHAKVTRVTGGKERCHSVLNSLRCLVDMSVGDPWVMVHDGARPCLGHGEINDLLDVVEQPGVNGAVLGMQVRDTMKRTDDQTEVTGTVERNDLWHAFTPQVVRLNLLLSAMEKALAAEHPVTDESSALEYCGYRVKMVAGSAANIKVTRAEDLRLAELLLQTSSGPGND